MSLKSSYEKRLAARQLLKVLEQHGWRLLGVHDSHHIFGKSGSIVRLSVPVHGNRPLKIGLLKHLLKQAGLSEDDL